MLCKINREGVLNEKTFKKILGSFWTLGTTDKAGWYLFGTSLFYNNAEREKSCLLGRKAVYTFSPDWLIHFYCIQYVWGLWICCCFLQQIQNLWRGISHSWPGRYPFLVHYKKPVSRYFHIFPDIHLENGVLRIYQSKGRNDRLVYLPDDLRQLCYEYLKTMTVKYKISQNGFFLPPIRQKYCRLLPSGSVSAWRGAKDLTLLSERWLAYS